MSANSPIQWPDEQQQTSSSNDYALSGRIMLASITILFVVVFFLVLLHLYARWYLLRLHHHTVTRRRRNRHNRPTRIIFYVDTNPPLSSSATALDATVLKSLPLFIYSSNIDPNTPECAVCLSEFQDGETGRVLPKCKHSFHTQCIDMWFYSHSTCPLCRSPVELAVEPEVTETTSSSSFVDRMKRVDVRIDIPNRNELTTENELQLSQGFMSPGSRLLSRIMNMNRKSAVSPSSGVGTSCERVAAELEVESTRESSRQGDFSMAAELRKVETRGGI
ncbi:hypothetical protein QVD17_28393 [Tagetes erecta]|uniref:RING-type E3 ubiquitin transferase n=1 Tax=Tagetes erecta TaxID=13708 RepID=A0AAD8KGM8_TARER|nr:hypothetical protein QVD17_28393 [Tagetes erecta]